MWRRDYSMAAREASRGEMSLDSPQRIVLATIV
jgi:hypothetical protein